MSRPRDRASATGLLPLMEARPWKDGKTVTYRYHPINGKPITLGTERAEAIRMVLDMNGQAPGTGTLKWVWDKFKASARWLAYTEGTKADYEGAWKQIEIRLGHMPIAEITSPTVARYVHVERAESPRRANIEKALLSRLFGHGIKLGVCEVNGTIGVEAHPEQPSDVEVDPKALAAFLTWLAKQSAQRRVLGMAAEFASLAGSRQVEFLPLTWMQVDREAGVVRPIRGKQRGRRRGKVVEPITISPALGALLDRLQAIRRNDCLTVVPTRDNNAYSARGFKTMWQRCIADAIEAKVLKAEQRFNFHALRHHYTTVHKQIYGTLPDLHADPALTARVYDHNREVRRRSV